MDYTQAIHQKLDAASALMFARDISIIDVLWSDGFRLVGSEVGEIAATRADLETLITKLFGYPFRLRWRWDRRPVQMENDMAWVFAEGFVEFVFDNDVQAIPYRLVAIFRRSGNDWVWRLYSGSEPIPAREF